MISNPETMDSASASGCTPNSFMSQLLRIMANLMRPDAVGPAEIGFRAMELVSRLRSGGITATNSPPSPPPSPAGHTQRRIAPSATERNHAAYAPPNPSARRAPATTRTHASHIASSAPRSSSPERRTSRMNGPNGGSDLLTPQHQRAGQIRQGGTGGRVSQSIHHPPCGPTEHVVWMEVEWQMPRAHHRERQGARRGSALPRPGAKPLRAISACIPVGQIGEAVDARGVDVRLHMGEAPVPTRRRAPLRAEPRPRSLESDRPKTRSENGPPVSRRRSSSRGRGRPGGRPAATRSIHVTLESRTPRSTRAVELEHPILVEVRHPAIRPSAQEFPPPQGNPGDRHPVPFG